MCFAEFPISFASGGRHLEKCPNITRWKRSPHFFFKPFSIISVCPVSFRVSDTLLNHFALSQLLVDVNTVNEITWGNWHLLRWGHGGNSEQWEHGIQVRAAVDDGAFIRLLNTLTGQVMGSWNDCTQGNSGHSLYKLEWEFEMHSHWLMREDTDSAVQGHSFVSGP